jgi:hypothetical protein
MGDRRLRPAAARRSTGRLAAEPSGGRWRAPARGQVVSAVARKVRDCLTGPLRDDGGTAMDYVMVESRGGHGVHSYGQFDAFRPVHRWIWVGADGSGLIREIAGPCSFYTPGGKVRWEGAGSPTLPEGLSNDVYGPGELSGTASRLAAGRQDPATASVVLKARPPGSLRDVSELLGETILPTETRGAVYGLAGQLPGVETLSAVSDQLGRPGHGLAGLDANGDRREIVFGDGCELLGYQLTLLHPDSDYAAQGTVISWTAYLERQWANQLPPDTPSIPHHA